MIDAGFGLLKLEGTGLFGILSLQRTESFPPVKKLEVFGPLVAKRLVIELSTWPSNC